MAWEKLRRYVERVRGRFRLHLAILFGSRARGDHGPCSDYDLLLIGEFEKPYLERLKVLIELDEGLGIPIEPHPYTLAEALRMLEVGNPVIVDALEEGVVLYSDEEARKLFRKYQAMRRAGKLRRTRTSITF